MTRAEFIRRLVLETICDDFENVDQVILRYVVDIGAKCGVVIRRADVLEALRVLVEAGLAKPYDLRAARGDPFSGEIQGMPPLDIAEEEYKTYFYVTKKGMEFQRADPSWWPLDENDAARVDWEAPQP